VPRQTSATAAPPAAPVVQRLAAQLLAGRPARDPVAVVRRLLAVQGQDARGARLAIRARSSGLVASDVDDALSEQRSLLITWLNRGTLHLVCSEDYPWLHALTTPRLNTACARRLREEGVAPAAAERGVRTIARALGEEGPLTREQLRERLDAANVRTQGQALVHVLMLATLRGVAVRAPMIGSQHAYALVADWLGTPPPVDRDLALAELARRYLAGHAPADARDLAKWSGLALRDARGGLAAIADELHERADGLLELQRQARSRARQPPAPRLLGAFDPLLLGWSSRDPIVGANKTLVTVNGLFRPFALVRARAVARWRLLKREVVLEPFAQIARADRAALETDAQDVLRYLGLTSASVKPS
jgi:Winged helix DNA-binding domain